MTPTPAPIHVTIDGTTHPIRDNDQEAGSLLRLAGREPKTWDLFLVKRNGVEHFAKAFLLAANSRPA